MHTHWWALCLWLSIQCPSIGGEGQSVWSVMIFAKASLIHVAPSPPTCTHTHTHTHTPYTHTGSPPLQPDLNVWPPSLPTSTTSQCTTAQSLTFPSRGPPSALHPLSLPWRRNLVKGATHTLDLFAQLCLETRHWQQWVVKWRFLLNKFLSGAMNWRVNEASAHISNLCSLMNSSWANNPQTTWYKSQSTHGRSKGSFWGSSIHRSRRNPHNSTRIGIVVSFQQMWGLSPPTPNPMTEPWNIWHGHTPYTIKSWIHTCHTDRQFLFQKKQ